MNRRKGIHPEQYAGVYQRYDDIPDRYRLETYAPQYEGEDTWQAYVDDVLVPTHEPVSDWMRKSIWLAGESWLEHMDDREPHHALARPVDAEAWCRDLLDGRAKKTCYELYFVRIYQFYDHMVRVSSHPHVYNPLLLAAIEYEHAETVWRYRIETRPEAVDRE